MATDCDVTGRGLQLCGRIRQGVVRLKLILTWMSLNTEQEREMETGSS